MIIIILVVSRIIIDFKKKPESIRLGFTIIMKFKELHDICVPQKNINYPLKYSEFSNCIITIIIL